VVGPDEDLLELMRQGDKNAAIMVAIGAASMCWENPEGGGVFDSTQAVKIAATLATYLSTDGGIAQADAAWLEVMVQNSIPANPNDQSINWEGAGREYALQVLQHARAGPISLNEVKLQRIKLLAEKYGGLGLTQVPLHTIQEAMR
jgi:hypothetical protein